jgi:N-acetylneuraminic acid mutarotase
MPRSLSSILTSIFIGIFAFAICAEQSFSETKILTSADDFLPGYFVNTLVSSEGDGAVTMAPVAVPGAWQASSALPNPVSYHAAALYGRYIYVIGGRQGPSSSFLPDVLYTTIGPDGTLGSWKATTPLPEGRAFHSAIAYGGYLYVVGGDRPGFEVTPEVFYARIGSDGQLGPWQKANPLPDQDGRDLAALVAAYGRLYLVTGAPNGVFSGTSTVFSADIMANGSLGKWEQDRSLPDEAARLGASAFYSNGRLFVVGGNAPGFEMADVPLNSAWAADVRPGDKLGMWVSTNEIVVPVRDAQGNVTGSRTEARLYASNSSVVAGGHLVLVCGHAKAEGDDQAAASQTVLVGRLLPNGDVGSWDYAAPYPLKISRTAAVAIGNKVVVIGGRDAGGDDRSDVYVSELTSLLPESIVSWGGYESPIVDLGQTARITSLRWEATGSAAVKMRVRVADETGVWSKWTEPSDQREIPIGATGRYVRFAVEFTGDGRSTASLTSVQINYGAEAPVVYGDINGDGRVTMQDALEAIQIAARLKKPTPAQLNAGDVAPKPGRGPRLGQAFGDGAINILDVSRILRAALGLEKVLP